MNFCQVFIVKVLLFSVATVGAVTPPAAGEALRTYVWECPLSSFEAVGYRASVAKLIESYEQATGVPLKIEKRQRVGIKIDTNSGPGLATPQALVQAVIEVLEDRGIAREKMFLIDKNESQLRDAGYIKGYHQEHYAFLGVPVLILDSERYYHPDWFYESNLPTKEPALRLQRETELSYQEHPDERKSYLPLPLIAEVEFWINLPIATDSQSFAINGALANATLWNISNNRRFFDNPVNASVAIAEIAGIPELKRGWIFTLVTLECYQYIGGPQFNSLYTISEPKLWLSTNPVALDALLLKRINYWRERSKFPVIEQQPAFFEYAKNFGYGPYHFDELKLLLLTSDSSNP